jgi:hypothetical protein
MPRMNGFELLKAYDKLDVSFKSKVIITMLKTSLNPEDLVEANKFVYVKEFHHKTLTSEGIIEIVDKYF